MRVLGWFGVWLVACGPGSAMVDAGSGEVDGGADTGVTIDASSELDAAIDASSELDADVERDAGDALDAGNRDAGDRDAGDELDAGTDAGTDVGTDAGTDAGTDTGPACDLVRRLRVPARPDLRRTQRARERLRGPAAAERVHAVLDAGASRRELSARILPGARGE